MNNAENSNRLNHLGRPKPYFRTDSQLCSSRHVGKPQTNFQQILFPQNETENQRFYKAL